MISAVIFDLDGTLLDTLDDLGDSMNSVLQKMGCHMHEIDAYRHFIGNGIRMLVVRALPEDRRQDETVDAGVNAMREEYAERWAAKTRLYDGVTALLEELTRRRLPLAVLVLASASLALAQGDDLVLLEQTAGGTYEIDGEWNRAASTRVRVECVPGALTVLVPPAT